MPKSYFFKPKNDFLNSIIVFQVQLARTTPCLNNNSIFVLHPKDWAVSEGATVQQPTVAPLATEFVEEIEDEILLPGLDYEASASLTNRFDFKFKSGTILKSLTLA